MSEEQSIERAIGAFRNLSVEDTATLADLSERIQHHEGEWSDIRGGERLADGTLAMPYTQNDPLIHEFVSFMSDHSLTVVFNWNEWQEGRDLITSDDPVKYADLDLETVLMLLTTMIRKERFNEGTLARLLASDDIQKLIKRLLALKRA